MWKALGALACAVIVAACAGLPAPPTSLVSRLPQSIGGEPVVYTERAVAELGDQARFFEAAVRGVGGDPGTARVAIGTGLAGFTLIALQVPGAAARQLSDAVLKAADVDATRREFVVVGGKPTTRLPVAASGASGRLYLYEMGDTLIVITTSRPDLADEALHALP